MKSFVAKFVVLALSVTALLAFGSHVEAGAPLAAPSPASFIQVPPPECIVERMHAAVNPHATVVKFASASIGTVGNPIPSYAMAQFRDSSGNLYEVVAGDNNSKPVDIISGGGGDNTVNDLQAVGIDAGSASALVGSWRAFPGGEQCNYPFWAP